MPAYTQEASPKAAPNPLQHLRSSSCSYRRPPCPSMATQGILTQQQPLPRVGTESCRSSVWSRVTTPFSGQPSNKLTKYPLQSCLYKASKEEQDVQKPIAKDRVIENKALTWPLKQGSKLRATSSSLLLLYPVQHQHHHHHHYYYTLYLLYKLRIPPGLVLERSFWD